MRRVFLALVVLAVIAFAGNSFPVAGGYIPGGGTDADYLQYDDGSIAWICWPGDWRGVWFNTDDFIPGGISYSMDFSEYWFYHHDDYPWDVSDFYAEVWNGDYMTPTALLDQTMLTAIHFAPVFANYGTPLEAETNFWGLANLTMSAGGWPSMLSDAAPTAIAHSYYSDDFYVWEPWTYGDFFVRVDGLIIPDALDNVTWGAIKSIF